MILLFILNYLLYQNRKIIKWKKLSSSLLFLVSFCLLLRNLLIYHCFLCGLLRRQSNLCQRKCCIFYSKHGTSKPVSYCKPFIEWAPLVLILLLFQGGVHCLLSSFHPLRRRRITVQLINPRLDPIILLDPSYLQRDVREGTLAKMTPPRFTYCRLPFHLHWHDSAWHRPRIMVVHSTLHLFFLRSIGFVALIGRESVIWSKPRDKLDGSSASVYQKMYVVGRCRSMAGLGRHNIGWRRCLCLMVSSYSLFMSFSTDSG